MISSAACTSYPRIPLQLAQLRMLSSSVRSRKPRKLPQLTSAMPQAPADGISCHHRQAVAKALLLAAPLQVGIPCTARGQHMAQLQLPTECRGRMEARKRPAENSFSSQGREEGLPHACTAGDDALPDREILRTLFGYLWNPEHGFRGRLAVAMGLLCVSKGLNISVRPTAIACVWAPTAHICISARAPTSAASPRDGPAMLAGTGARGADAPPHFQGAECTCRRRAVLGG